MAADKKTWRSKGAEELVDVRQEITDRILEALENGTAPWQKPWVTVGRPFNPQSDNVYSGVNSILLQLSGRSDNRWMTYRQASDAGYQVRKGEKGTTVVKVVDAKVKGRDDKEPLGEGSEANEEGAERTVKSLKRYTVFNAEQIEGMPPMAELPAPAPMVEEVELALRALCQKTGLKYEEQGDRAYYSPSEDKVVMPPRELFKDIEGFCATLAHEMNHSVGAPHRLDRKEGMAGVFGSQDYAREELVAEMASAMTCQMFGVQQTEEHFANHASYVDSWRKLLQDKNEIFRAASAAEKSCKFIVDHARTFANEQKMEASVNLDTRAAVAAVEAELPPPLARETGARSFEGVFVGARDDLVVQKWGQMEVAHKSSELQDHAFLRPGDKMKVEYPSAAAASEKAKVSLVPAKSREASRDAGMSR